MFLQEITQSGVPDIDQIEGRQLQARFRYRLKIRRDLRQRFRSEYLGQLSRRRDWKSDTIHVGDVVLISNDNQKRIEWPLGLVIEVIPGKDGHVRVVRLRTEPGELVRPIQRLCPLEMSSADADDILPINKYQPSPVHQNIPPTKRREVTLSPPVPATSEAEPTEQPMGPDPIQDETDAGEGGPSQPIKRTRSGRVIKPLRRLSY